MISNAIKKTPSCTLDVVNTTYFAIRKLVDEDYQIPEAIYGARKMLSNIKGILTEENIEHITKEGGQ